jgi:hypothetical protein
MLFKGMFRRAGNAPIERLVSGRTKAHELDGLLPWNWREPSRFGTEVRDAGVAA